MLLSKWTAVKPLNREKHFLVLDFRDRSIELVSKALDDALKDLPLLFQGATPGYAKLESKDADEHGDLR